jgi:hypothetical protein
MVGHTNTEFTAHNLHHGAKIECLPGRGNLAEILYEGKNDCAELSYRKIS